MQFTRAGVSLCALQEVEKYSNAFFNTLGVEPKDSVLAPKVYTKFTGPDVPECKMLVYLPKYSTTS